jgi:predicted nucleotidyltransferase
MMNTYKLNYNQLRQQPEISEMLTALERGLAKYKVDFYLVGAVARDVWMSGINKIEPRRTTGDIDFAVFINNIATYDELREHLINEEGFFPYKGNNFVLIWKGRTQVDLLPFGAIEDENGRVSTNGIGLTNISLQGFTEIYEEGLPELNLEGEHQFKFCTLPGIVLLKMIAFDDRPEHRRDDMKDISDILNHFFDMYDEEIWSNHSDLFGDKEIDLKHLAARVMGREIKKIAKRNPKLEDRVMSILERNTDDAPNSGMAIVMVEYFKNTVEDNVKLIGQIKMGFQEP